MSKLHGNKKGRIKKKLGFLSLNFIKLCRNIQRSVWQLLEFEQIQNDGRCHGNQGATNVKFKRTADPFENWHKNRSPLKVVLFVFKIFKMATNIKIKKIVKNSKWTDFNGNGYLLGVRHADHMATILVCYGGHLEPKMVAKIQRCSDFGEIWFPTW